MRISILPHPFLFVLIFTIFCITNIDPSTCQCLQDQKVLLLEFKNNIAFNSSASRKLVRWNQHDDCCSWNGVECDVAGHVIGLYLDFEEISGGFENSLASLFSLEYLENLNLAYCRFGAIQIPTGIQNLTKLTHLNLSNAGFVGQIPGEISRLKSLVSLDLSTLFPGIVPLKLENPNLKEFVENLTGLKQLNLDGVNISFQGSDWCQILSSSLPDLRNLSLRGCYLSGPLHRSLTQLHSLSVLQLDRNNLSSEVPEVFANFSNLVTLSLSSCSLLGIFPKKIFQVPTLQNLDLSNNKLLSGTLPQFNEGGSLRNIVLSYTNFSGLLPNSISNLVMLSKLEMSNCTFTGQIPSTIGNLTEVDYLDFSFNNFTGSIPLFYLLTKLTYIDFSSNSLTGSISSAHFEGLSNLVYISLSRNLLSGNIPSSLFSSLPSLQKLLLSDNKFNGQVEEYPNPSFSLLATIDLSSNRLEGPIPKFFFELGQLKVLSLSSNFFNGTLQLSMFKNPYISKLELSHNDLSIDPTGLPSSFPHINVLKLASCKLQKFPVLPMESSLAILDLSSNQLKGEIPNWIWEIGNGSLNHLNLSFNLLSGFQKPFNFPSLTVLDLHSNRFQGELPIPPVFSVYVDYSSNYFNSSIPHDIGSFISFAVFFSVSNNNLTGGIPTSIFCEATSLLVFDLSSNSLNGVIPPSLPKKNWSLKVLNLGRNNLSGEIPDTFPVDCTLRTLDLNKNMLRGKIPESLVNCGVLEVLNIGNNRIKDTFPCMLMNTRLRVLILRSNSFYGDIKCFGGIEGWSYLQIIDISANNFSGDMSPLSFSNWKGMTDGNGNDQTHYNYLRFNYMRLNDYHYQDAVTLTIKGLELELTKILIAFASIDFSRNKFHGKIPYAIGDLKSLYLLNLSHNALTDTIPASIGNLTKLGSLDLSANQLTGKIPNEIAKLLFISFLNLSFNKLFGLIPTGPQLQTLPAESYEGNAGLCGFPLNTTCENTEDQNGVSLSNLEKNKIEWEYVSAALGFVVGLGSIVWILLFCGRWRQRYFDKVDKLLLKIIPLQNGTLKTRRKGNQKSSEGTQLS